MTEAVKEETTLLDLVARYKICSYDETKLYRLANSHLYYIS
jgi:hypothetical protein